MSDQAIEALGSYDWGQDYAALKPIEDAVVSTQGDAEARKDRNHDPRRAENHQRVGHKRGKGQFPATTRA